MDGYVDDRGSDRNEPDLESYLLGLPPGQRPQHAQCLADVGGVNEIAQLRSLELSARAPADDAEGDVRLLDAPVERHQRHADRRALERAAEAVLRG